jgi:hypothetical protein
MQECGNSVYFNCWLIILAFHRYSFASEHILYPMVCEILFSNLYLDLIESEINYNYNYIV